MVKTQSIFDPRYKDLIQVLVDRRHKNGWSQIKFSQISGMLPNTVARIELCERRLDLIEAIDYMKKLEMPKSEIKKTLNDIVDCR